MPSLTDAADPVTRPPAESSPDAIPELVQLGARLEQARRERGLSCADLADRLRLGTDQLDALERGDRTGLREPVFVVALAKRVAGALGVNVEEEIAALRRSRLMADSPPSRPVPLPASTSRAVSTPRPSAAGSPFPRRRPGRSVLLPVGLLLLAGVIGAGALVWTQGRRSQPDRAAGRGDPADRSATAEPPLAVKPKPAAAPPTTLVLQALEPSWLEVRDTAGTPLFRGTLEGERLFPLGKGLQVLAGRPDQVKVTVGDQPARVLGTIDDVEWQSFPASPRGPGSPEPPEAP